jgi:small subunit ribosomal protein S16
MLVIRMARTGRTKYPTYRIVAAESSRAATGKFVAILGHYNPHSKEIVLKKDEIEKYIGNGAQPSNTVVRLLKQEKVKLPDWATFQERHKKGKHAPAEVVEAPAAVAVPEAAAPEVAPEASTAVGPEAAEANSEAVTEDQAASAPEDTAAGEAEQAEAASDETAGDAAIEAASEAEATKTAE